MPSVAPSIQGRGGRWRWSARVAAASLVTSLVVMLAGALWSPMAGAYHVPDGVRTVAATSPASAAEGPAPAWNIVHLAENTGGSTRPRIAGDVVAWISQGTVSVHDLGSGDTRVLQAPRVFLETALRVAGDRVVWVAGTDVDSMSVYAYEVGIDQAPVRISGAGDVSFFAETDGRWVVWAEGASGDIVLYDAVAKTTTRVTDDAVRDARPHVAGGLVVWEKGAEDVSEIYAHDIATTRTWRLTDNARPDSSPYTDGSRVVWLTHDGHDTEVNLYDVASGETVALTDDDVMQTRVRVFGDRVVFTWYSVLDNRLIHGGGFRVLEARPGPTLVFGRLYDHSHPVVPLFVAFDGEHVAWLRPTDDAGTSVDLQVASLSEFLPSFVSVNTLGANMPDLSGGRVAWEALVPVGATGSRWDLFVAAPAGDPLVQPSPLTFIDVPAGHQYGDAIRAMAAAGLVNGYALAPLTNEFRPERPVWRAQFAKMVVGALGIPVDETMHTRFTDMPPDPSDDLYPNQYIAAAYFAGITRGVTDTIFEPWSAVSRAQLVTMVVRGLSGTGSAVLAAPPAGYAGSLGDFDPAHTENMRVAEFNGLLDGLAGFGPAWDPWAPATRGEVAQVLANVMANASTLALAGVVD
ncbi:MAG: S-layer homology domain-containing protein [Thermoleophilia bacterium]